MKHKCKQAVKGLFGRYSFCGKDAPVANVYEGGFTVYTCQEHAFLNTADKGDER